MNIVRFEPWSMTDLINRDLDRRPVPDTVKTVTADWVPAVDIVAEKDHRVCPGATFCRSRTSLF